MSRVAVEHLRTALWSRLDDGSLRGSELEPVVRAALQSTYISWLQRIYRYVGVQELAAPDRGKILFREPHPGQVAGDVLLGYTVPSEIPTYLRWADFRGHVFIAGQSQSGKSTLARFVVTQLVSDRSVLVLHNK